MPPLGTNAVVRPEVAAAVPAVTTNFAGLDADDSGGYPADAQLAVGPSHIVEMVFFTGRIFDKAGRVIQSRRLRDFFGVPAGWVEADPKVIYDALSGRWIAAYVASDEATEARAYLAVSDSSDPTGAWCTNYFSWTATAPLADQPGIGVTDDKVTVSVNLYPNYADPSQVHEETMVTQKSDWLTCASSIGFAGLLPRSTGTARPAHSLSSISDQFLAEFDRGSTNQVCVDRITGTPNAGNVARTTTCRALTYLQADPLSGAPQLGGLVLIGTNDNRALESVWRDGTLWVSANTSCDWGSGQIRACLHLVEVDTETMTIGQEILFGHPDYWYYYPSIRLDGSGDLSVVFSYSSSSDYVSAAISGRLSTDSPSTLRNPTSLKAGEVYYTSVVIDGVARWGNYLGAAVDPSDSSCVWVVGEYAKNTTGGADWGTYIAATSLSDGGCSGVAPTPTVSPTPTPTSTPTPTRTVTPTPTSTQALTPTPAGRRGDANCDGRVDSVDAALILQDGAGLPASLPCRQNADVDHNGSISSIDAALVLQYVAGLIRSLPV